MGLRRLLRNLRAVLFLFRDAFREWIGDHPDLLAAGLGYFTLFSIGPILIITTATLGRFWTQPAVQDWMVRHLDAALGPQAMASLQAWLDAAAAAGKGRATVISFLLLAFGASRVFDQLRIAMDFIWEVNPSQKGFVRGFLRTFLLNAGMLVGFTLFIFLYIAMEAVLELLHRGLSPSLPAFIGPLQIVDNASVLLGLVLFTFLFAAAYKWIPDVSLRWSDVWPGAVVTSVFLIIARSFISLYLRFQPFDTLYGAAGSLIVLMIWIYAAAQIFFFGAEFNWVYAHRHGSRSIR